MSLQELTMYRTNKIAFFLTYSLKSFEKFYSLKSFPLSNSTTMIPGILFSQHLRCRLVWNPKQQAGLQPQWYTGFATWISSVFDKKKLRQWEKSPTVTQQQQEGAKLFKGSSKANTAPATQQSCEFCMPPMNKWIKLEESISVKWLIKLMDPKILVTEPSVCQRQKTHSGKSQFADIS